MLSWNGIYYTHTHPSKTTSILLYMNLVHRKICEPTKYVVKHQWIIRKENTIKISKKCKKSESFDEKIREKVDSFYVVSSFPLKNNNKKKLFHVTVENNLRHCTWVHQRLYIWYKSKKVELMVGEYKRQYEMASKKVDLFKYKFAVYWIEFTLESLAYRTQPSAAWFVFLFDSSRYVLVLKEFTKKSKADAADKFLRTLLV